VSSDPGSLLDGLAAYQPPAVDAWLDLTRV